MSDAWPDLPLEAWRDTRDTLHLYTQVVGKLRLARAPREPEWAQVTLYVTSRGLTTSPVPDGDRTFQIDFDFVDHELRILTSDGGASTLALEPKSVAAFHADVLGAVAALGIEVEISPKPQEIPDAVPFTVDEQHAAYDPEWAQRFWRSLVQVDMVMKEHRARFGGRTSLVHFFWGSFDLALTLHAGPGYVTTGYWPGDDRFPEPAFFAYTAPKPDGLEDAAIRPAEASWSAGLGEFLLRYEDVRRAASPRTALLDFLESTYAAGASLSGWDRQLLTPR